MDNNSDNEQPLSPNIGLDKADVKRKRSKVRGRQKSVLNRLVAWGMRDSEHLASPHSITEDVDIYYAKPRLSGKLLKSTRFEVLEAEDKQKHDEQEGDEEHTQTQKPRRGSQKGGQMDLDIR